MPDKRKQDIQSSVKGNMDGVSSALKDISHQPSDQTQVQVPENEIRTSNEGIKEEGKGALFGPFSWLFLLVFFLGGMGAGLWGGRVFTPSGSGPKSMRYRAASMPSSTSHVVKGLFYPLEGGSRSLYLSLSLRIKKQYTDDQASIRFQKLYETIFEAVQGMEVKELVSDLGMKALKLRILGLIHRQHPRLRVEDIHFLDYTIL